VAGYDSLAHLAGYAASLFEISMTESMNTRTFAARCRREGKIAYSGKRSSDQPRETWANLFKSQGMKYPQPRIRMLDGFNEGWIEFESNGADSIKGKTKFETVLRGLVAQAA
jgi:predicted metalloprotease